MPVPLEDLNVPEIRLGKYKHYKGDIMEVLGVALHSETLEPFVTYRHISGPRTGEGHYWVRPYAMFLGEVEVDGRKVPRFELMRET